MTNEEKTKWLELYDKRICYRVYEMSNRLSSDVRKDLYQIARLSFLKSLDTWDASRDITPWSYAKKKIEWDVILYIRTKIAVIKTGENKPFHKQAADFIWDLIPCYNEDLEKYIEDEYRKWLIEEIKRRAETIPDIRQRRNTLDLLNEKFKGTRFMRHVTLKKLRKLVKLWGLTYP